MRLESAEYPTKEEIDDADRRQLCYWYRFLLSPGVGAIGRYDHLDVLRAEMQIMQYLTVCFNRAGGFTPAISRELTW